MLNTIISYAETYAVQEQVNACRPQVHCAKSTLINGISSLQVVSEAFSTKSTRCFV